MKEPGKRGCLDYILIVFAALILFRIISSSFPNNESIDSDSQNTPVEYVVCDISTMLDELNDNALKAEKKYSDQYIQITGKLGVIDSDGKYICIEPVDGGMFDDIQCYIQNDNQVDTVIQMHKGDDITIRGQVTSIGEVLGYHMDINSIE